MNDQLSLLLRREGLGQNGQSRWFSISLKDLSDLGTSWTILRVVIITTDKTKVSRFALIPIVNKWSFGSLMQTHHRHVRSHQDLLFPRTEELECSPKPLYREFSHPQNALYDLPLGYRELGLRVITSLELMESGLINPRTPMTILP
jgi:hypothetical protein